MSRQDDATLGFLGGAALALVILASLSMIDMDDTKSVAPQPAACETTTLEGG